MIFGTISPKIFIKFYPEKYRKRGYALLSGLLLFVFTSIIASFIPDNAEETFESTNNHANFDVSINQDSIVDTTNSPAKRKKPTTWKYEYSVDRMTDDTIRFATTRSNNYEEFDFPYQGGSTVNMTLRKRNGKNEIYFRVINGQIMSSYNSDEYVRIRFDKSQPVTYYFNSADDGSSDYAFINNSNQLINKIKNSKLIAVEIPFYQEGRRVFYFSVEDLEW